MTPSSKPQSLGCRYEAPTFGASYPDGTCIDGFMWDLDSCDEPGGMLQSGGEIPCPWCNTRQHVEEFQRPTPGNAKQRRTRRRFLVKQIRAWAEARSSFPPSGYATR